eukprot:10658650-Alexandrium_andersonii.AAC.1
MPGQGRPEAMEGSEGRRRTGCNCRGALCRREGDSPRRTDCPLNPAEGSGDLRNRAAPRGHALVPRTI